jgi:hypothetical protein
MSIISRVQLGFTVALYLIFSPAMAHESGGWQSAHQMTEAAKTFISSLDAEQKKNAIFPLDDAGRTTWSNLPIIMVRPGGLLISDMNAEQRTAVHKLLRASMSSQGYAKFAGIMRLEDQAHLDALERLKNNADAPPIGQAFANAYDSTNYAVAIFGEPGKEHWGWKIAGHHAAVNFTVANGRVGFTPTFLGSNPMVVKSGKHAGLMVLPQEGQRGIELMQSLSPKMQNVAKVSEDKPNDIIEGPGRRASLSAFEGLKASQLSSDQMKLLKVLVSEYVGNSDFDTAAAQLALIENSGWGELWFSWRGPVDPAGRFYYRVHGPRILIEYIRQNDNHDHTIVRDPKNDYGEDWLGNHYEEHHPSMEEAMKNARQAVHQEN